jgi:predicted house-cleaning noncanonical NTP pyrophosphatase (MazG superfamily)
MSSLKLIISERGKEFLVLDRFKYRFHKELSSGVKRWVCSISGNKKCPAYLKTEGKTNIVEVIDNHNHPPHEEKILNRNELSNSLKRKATEDLNERPTKLIHQELRKGDIETLTNCDIKRIRKNIYQARRGVLPKLPTTQEEIHHALNSHSIKTNRDGPFLLVNDAENKIIMFSCQTNLEFLCSSKFIYVDGTFNCCAKFFLQMFTIHRLAGDHYNKCL